VRIRALEERTAEKEMKDRGKKVIRLGERASKANKENQMGMANGVDRPKDRREEGIREREEGKRKREGDLFLPINGESEPSCIKEHDCQQILQMVEAAASKLEAACTEYRTALYPVHLDILNQQIALLHSTLPLPLPDQTLRISTLLITLQKKLCSYVDSVGDIVPRLLEGWRCEGRQEMGELLREKLREVSDIKWSFKEFYEEPEDLQAIA
jgi:hypothetical protein